MHKFATFRDGPLTRRAPETIRYGTGRCALGALAVASSERGIVSIMVRDTQARLIRDLEARFPKANLVRDPQATLVTKVACYIAAPFRPFPLPLDIRGTDLQRRIWDEIRRIPFGETSTYSRIAEAREAGSPSPSVSPSPAQVVEPARRPLVPLGRLRSEAQAESRSAQVSSPSAVCAMN